MSLRIIEDKLRKCGALIKIVQSKYGHPLYDSSCKYVVHCVTHDVRTGENLILRAREKASRSFKWCAGCYRKKQAKNQPKTPSKRGRPPGSKNRPKVS